MEKILIAYDYVEKTAYEKKIAISNDIAYNSDAYSDLVNNECRIFGGQISGFKAHVQAGAKGDVVTVKDIDAYIQNAGKNYGGLIYMFVDDLGIGIHNASALNKSHPLYVNIDPEGRLNVFKGIQKNIKCSKAFLISDKPTDFNMPRYCAIINQNPYFVLLFSDIHIGEYFLGILNSKRTDNKLRLVEAIANK